MTKCYTGVQDVASGGSSIDGMIFSLPEFVSREKILKIKMCAHHTQRDTDGRVTESEGYRRPLSFSGRSKAFDVLYTKR